MIVTAGQTGIVTKQTAIGARTVWKSTRPLRKRKVTLKEIVILTDSFGKDDKLIHTLRTLFPECDIRIHLKQTESSANIWQIQEVATTHKRGKNGKRAHCG